MSHDAVYLHVGMPKTGTTYLQEFLWTNRSRLKEAGLLYPADKPGRQFRAVLDLQGGDFAGNKMSDVEGSWAQVADQARAWPGRSVVSHEMMAGLTDKQADRALGDLSPRPVHVVVTLRDLSRIVPATWQEDAKNRFVESWPDFLARVRPDGEQRDRRFWSLQDVPGTLRRWAERVPADHIHVVTVPPAGSPRGLLLARFAEVVGIDPAEFQQDVKVANDSIGPVEVALLHRLNDASRDRVAWPAYHHSIKHFAVPKVLAVRPDVTRMRLPESDLGWVREETDRVAATIRELGVDVVGDVEDLTPRPVSGPAPDPSTVTERQELDAAVDVVLGFARRLHDLHTTLERTRNELQRTREALAEAEVTIVERAKRRVVAYGRRHRGVDAALNVYRRARERRGS